MPRDPFRSEELVEFTGDNIGDFLLNVLTVGLYNQPDLIIREYIQNSHDALYSSSFQPEPGRIEIKVDWPNIHIYDNGPGMDHDELLHAMSGLGKSLKTISVDSGFMGIGKLAGLSMASRVEIHSSKYGSSEKNWVAFEAGEMLTGIMERRLKGEQHSILDTLNQHTKVNVKPLPEDTAKQYTSVHLLGILEDYKNKITDVEGFARSIGLIAPVRQNPEFEHSVEIEDKLSLMIPDHYKPIDIFVNGLPIYRPYVAGLDRPKEIQVLDEENNFLAYGWACLNVGSVRNKRQISDEALRGIALMQRGIAIGRRSFAEEIGLYPSTGNIIHFRWYCGELYITDPRVIVSADRTRLRQSEYVVDFIEKASKELNKLARYADNWANQDNAEFIVRESKEHLSQIESQVKSQPLSSDLLPRVIAELGEIRTNVSKKKKFVVKNEVKTDVELIEKKVDETLNLLTTAQKDKIQQRQDNMVPISTVVGEQDRVTEEMLGNQLKKSEGVIVYDLPERLGFSSRETLIYRTMIQAIANSCGGRNSADFTRITDAIERTLVTTFGDISTEVMI